ncbi:hypothetical protein [Streptomyces avidinii]
MTLQRRILILATAVALLAAVCVLAVLRASSRADEKDRARAGGPQITRGEFSLAPGDGGRRIVFRNMAWGPHRDELATVAAGAPEGTRTASGVSCLRFHAAGGTGICLRADRSGVQEGYRAVVLDARLKEVSAHSLGGVPPGPGSRPAGTSPRGPSSSAGTRTRVRTSPRGPRCSTCARAGWRPRWRTSRSSRTGSRTAPPTSTSGGSPSPPTSGPSTRRSPPAAAPTWSAATWPRAP